MERFVCLDIGDKRIGVAVSDPFNEYALPVLTYNRKNLKTDLEGIVKIICDKGATGVVCGLPVNFDGTSSIQTEKAKFFIDKLKERLSVNVFTVDERCTTCEAEEVLIEQGKSREERKKFVDSLAAAEILQGFLNDYKKKENIMEEKKNNCNCNLDKHHEGHCDCGCEEHVHTHCDCGCEDECDCGEDIVELTTDDGKKLKFYFVGTIEYKGKNYSAFEPAEEIKGLEQDDLVIFEVSGDDEETADLIPIEDDALLDAVFQEFCRVLEEDELADEAEMLEPDGE